MPPEVATPPAPPATPPAPPPPNSSTPPAPPPPSPPAPPTPPAPPPPAPPEPDAPTVLDGAAPEVPFDWTAEGTHTKFVVKDKDGAIDEKASAAKMAKAYGVLEKHRQGPRPATAADYAINVPEAMKDVLTAEDPGIKAFVGKAHTLGFSQQQLDHVLSTYADLAPRLVNGAAGLDFDQATAALRQTWPTEEQYAAETFASRKAVEAFGEPSVMKDAGNIPSVVRLLAKVGKQLEGATMPTNAATPAAGDVKALMASPAYSDVSHVDHQKVTKQVNDWYAKQPGAATPI